MTRRTFPALTRPALTGTQGIFAQKRRGKSYTAQTQAEDWLEDGAQIAVVDPTGAWWGLRSSADGASPGYPITIFGGEHADAPLEVKAGGVIAEALVSERFSAVLDLSLLDSEEWPVVAGDFLETLYTLNRTAMHVFIDEADQFAPQMTGTKSQHRSRRVVNRLVRLGGIKGIGCTMITQRTALLDTNIREQCDTIVALQMNGTRDLESLRKWISNHATRDTIDEVMESLGSLPRGRAWVLSPATETFELQAVRAKRTYDSGRTPEPGEVLTPPKALAPVDVARLGAAIAATVEKAKANDPIALRARIAELEKQLAGKPGDSGAAEHVDKLEKDILRLHAEHEAELQGVRSQIDDMRAHALIAQSKLEDVDSAIASVLNVTATPRDRAFVAPSKATPAIASKPKRGPVRHLHERRTSVAHSEHDGDGPCVVCEPELSAKAPTSGDGQRDLVNAIAGLKAAGLARTLLAIAAWLNVHPRSSTFLKSIGEARRVGLLEGVELTPAGREYVDALQSDSVARDIVRRALPESQQRIVDTIASFRGRILTIQVLAAWVRCHPRSSSFLTDLGKLRERGFLSGTGLTALGAFVAQPRKLDDLEVLEQLEDLQRRMVESIGSVVTAPVGATVRLYVDLRELVRIGDVIATSTDRRYFVIFVRVQMRGKHRGRQHLHAVVLEDDSTLRNGLSTTEQNPSPVVHRIRWYSRDLRSKRARRRGRR